MKKVLILSVLLVFGLASMSIAQNANGIGYFALEIPSGVTITVDGDDSDWGWFDPSFVYGPDDLKENLVGEMPTKDDLDIMLMTAWTGTDRDNKLYGFCRVTDDELVLKQTELDAGWFDDEFEIIPDADNSGGPFRAEGVVTCVNAQQFTMHISTPGGYESPYCGGIWWMRYQAPAESHWVDELADAAITTVPPGAGDGASDVIVNYEYAIPLFDFVYPEGQASSPRHDLTGGETIGVTHEWNEADFDTDQRSHQVINSAENGAAWDADLIADYTLLMIGDYDAQTAVGASSWGEIKATFAR